MIISMFVSKNFLDAYTMLLFMRLWMEIARSDIYNPISIILIKFTKITFFPWKKILICLSYFYFFIILKMYMLVITKYCFLYFLYSHMFDFNYVYLYIGMFSLLKSYGYIMFWNITIRSLISWINRKINVVEYFFIELTEPILRVCRLFVPKIGEIDISAMVIIFTLYFLNFIGANLFPDVWYLL
ncbi:hypothetical protein GFK87_00354 [Candidatus Annandia pinicola]|nr:hypothetical protein GFK87_00354 [Candidatus Annandia pinicola]